VQKNIERRVDMHFDREGRQATIYLILLEHAATRCNTPQHTVTEETHIPAKEYSEEGRHAIV